jgi:hypothetical protein
VVGFGLSGLGQSWLSSRLQVGSGVLHVFHIRTRDEGAMVSLGHVLLLVDGKRAESVEDRWKCAVSPEASQS